MSLVLGHQGEHEVLHLQASGALAVDAFPADVEVGLLDLGERALSMDTTILRAHKPRSPAPPKKGVGYGSLLYYLASTRRRRRRGGGGGA